MLHPSYSDLINKVNSTVEEGEAPVVQSRYSIVIASAKRARQLIDGRAATIKNADGKKPLSVAVEELDAGTLKLSREGEAPVFEEDEVVEVTEETTEEVVEEDASEEFEEEMEGTFSGVNALKDALANMFEQADALEDDNFEDDDFEDEE